MRAASILATLLLALILSAALPRPGGAGLADFVSSFTSTEVAKSAEFRETSRACENMHFTGSCAFDCRYGTGECSAPGLVMSSYQEPFPMLTFQVTTWETWDFRNGIKPESLPEPP
jgi:hypothetical protein